MDQKDELKQIGFLIQETHRKMHLRHRKVLSEYRLNFSQFYALHFLNEHCPCKMSTLVKELTVTGASATAIADKLIRKGLVKREYSTADRRIVQILITDKGKNLIKSLEVKRRGFLSQILKKMNAADKTAFMRILQVFSSVLDDLNKT